MATKKKTKSPIKKAKKTAKKAAKKATKKASPKKSAKKQKVVKKSTGKKNLSSKSASKSKKTTVKKETNITRKSFTPHVTTLLPGMPAPDFKGLNQHGNEIKLSDFKGKKVILYFYPKDDTPGCTAEACSLRDGLSELNELNMDVIGVSADSVESHRKFAEKYNLPFHLISDPEKIIIKAYDVWGKKQFMGKVFDGLIRTTFIIDENGNISHVITDVNTKEHAQQIKELMG